MGDKWRVSKVIGERGCIIGFGLKKASSGDLMCRRGT